MTSDGENIHAISESEDEVNDEVDNPETINVGDFLLIKFEKKKTVIYYVVKILLKYGMLYLRKKAGSSKFVFHIGEDKASVHVKDVVSQLPKPILQRPARALATSSVQYSNARGREKERYTKVESRREKESESVNPKRMRVVIQAFRISL
ncbi:hypothetical protein EVAR_36469_1 [Eumeta japonica]|uniref:Uncharacterized protein n=1 Tax=Eumeta variegata TaxID=151549 RepID=A0A4C1WW12_EUMVA|nr:hypothetical protein EVAR_36469_1 [Eumeta japonica]